MITLVFEFEITQLKKCQQIIGSHHLMVSLKGQVAIVTGASNGYGVGIAHVLAQRGAIVYITGRDQERLESSVKSTGAHKGFKADVTSIADWDLVMSSVLGENNGRLDILINNAGAAIRVAPSTDLTDQEVEQCIATNLTGVMFGCARAARVMSKQGSGSIINISSACDRYAWPGFGAYSAAKAGMLQYGKCLYTELRPKGVKVTTLTPGWGNTNFKGASGRAPFSQEILDKCIQPDEIGKVVADLCELPLHLCIDEVVLLAMVQEIIPM